MAKASVQWVTKGSFAALALALGTAACSAAASDDQGASADSADELSLIPEDDLASYSPKKFACTAASFTGASGVVDGSMSLAASGRTLTVRAPLYAFAPGGGGVTLSITTTSALQKYVTADIGFMLYARPANTMLPWRRVEIGAAPLSIFREVHFEGDLIRFQGYPEAMKDRGVSSSVDAHTGGYATTKDIPALRGASTADVALFDAFEYAVLPLAYFTNFTSLPGTYAFRLSYACTYDCAHVPNDPCTFTQLSATPR